MTRCRLLPLLAADDQAVEADSRARHGAAEFKVAADLGNVEEHFFQVPCDGNFFDGIGQLSARDPQAGSAAGIVARDQVGAVAEKFGDVESLGNLSNDFLRGLLSRLEEIIPRPDPRGACQSARSVARSLKTKF